jgi:hypothetical protein
VELDDGVRSPRRRRIPMAGPVRRCYIAVPVGGLGVVRATGGCQRGGWGYVSECGAREGGRAAGQGEVVTGMV